MKTVKYGYDSFSIGKSYRHFHGYQSLENVLISHDAIYIISMIANRTHIETSKNQFYTHDYDISTYINLEAFVDLNYAAKRMQKFVESFTVLEQQEYYHDIFKLYLTILKKDIYVTKSKKYPATFNSWNVIEELIIINRTPIITTYSFESLIDLTLDFLTLNGISKTYNFNYSHHINYLEERFFFV